MFSYYLIPCYLVISIFLHLFIWHIWDNKNVVSLWYNCHHVSIYMFFKDIEKYLKLLTLYPSKYLRLEWQRKESTPQIQFSSKSGKPGYNRDLVSGQMAVRTSSE